MLRLNADGYRRRFSVPCALIDSYIKLADGPALKLLLCLLGSDGSLGDGEILSYTGLNPEQLKDAAMFWQELGVISECEKEAENIPAAAVSAPRPEAAPKAEPQESAIKVVHARFQPKDVADRLEHSPDLRELFHEAELTLGRLLKHADHETLLSLYDYYGFDEQSIVLILGYCADLGKTSARYFETVAKNLFEAGITDFNAIEREFERLKELHSYESSIRRALGMEVKMSPRQTEYIYGWKDLGFGEDMIKLARDKCVDATNKLSFQYIDRILHSWKEKGIDTPEAANAEQKPEQTDKARSFDIGEFDSFTLK